VVVTRVALTVTLRDGDRKPVLNEGSGTPCAAVAVPFTP
jgi:hypothetical protein